MKLSRRRFLVGCSSAIAAMAGARIGNLAFAQPGDTSRCDMLVVVFLRGGCDALNLVAPQSADEYQNSRPGLALNNTTVPNAAERLVLSNGLAGAEFWLHPAAADLYELYQQGVLAIVHACGLTNGTRSHFDAMDFMERGTPTNKLTSSGWLARHLSSSGVGSADGRLPAIAGSASVPTALLGASEALAIRQPGSFDLSGDWRYRDEQKRILRSVYNGSTPLHREGLNALNTIEQLSGATLPEPDPGIYTSDSSLESSFKAIAQLIKMDIGLQVATIDYGGWDTHDEQERVFPTRVGDLAGSLQSFYNDLSAYHNRLTLVVMSEFGRRLTKNASDGTDHGYGGLMLVLGGNVRGGRMYGAWPGLAKEQLNKRVDLEVTTDYRVVLGEILANRLQNPQLGQVFPGLNADLYNAQVRGIVSDPAAQPRIDFTPASLGATTDVYLPLVQN